MAETCPSCGAAASGRFCDQCGAGLDPGTCRQCGAALPRGARFCNQCGTPVTSGVEGAARSGVGSPVGWGPLLPWIVAGVALLALLLFVVAQRGRGGGESEQAAAQGGTPPFAPAAEAGQGGAGAPGAPGTGTPPDLSQMSPRQAADRLFNRVMTAVSQSDTPQVAQFLPMAIQAYGMAAPLDADGRYHLATLHLVAGNFPAARAQADSILASAPTHLFGLYTAAQAEEARGNREAAAQLYRRFLAAFDAEQGKPLPEYRDHAQGLPGMRQTAQQFVAAEGG